MKQISTLFIVAVMIFTGGCAVNPVPFSEAENLSRGEADSQQIYASQEPVTGTIDIYDAMARALHYNMDKRVRLAEMAVANYQVDADLWEMVPEIKTNAAVESRSNVSASSSESILTGTQSLEPSTSTEDTVRNFNLRMAFNILDFGVSYLRARQSGYHPS